MRAKSIQPPDYPKVIGCDYCAQTIWNMQQSLDWPKPAAAQIVKRLKSPVPVGSSVALRISLTSWKWSKFHASAQSLCACNLLRVSVEQWNPSADRVSLLFIYSIHFYFFVFVFCFCFYLFNGMQFTWGIPGVSAGVELHKVNILIHSDYVSTPEQFSDSWRIRNQTSIPVSS